MSAMAVKPTVATPLASKKSAFAGRGVAAVAPKTATGGRASLQVRASSALLPRRPRRDASRRGVLRDRVGGRNGGVARDARDRASPPRARSGSVARRAKSVILRVGFLHRALSERAREVADARSRRLSRALASRRARTPSSPRRRDDAARPVRVARPPSRLGRRARSGVASDRGFSGGARLSIHERPERRVHFFVAGLDLTVRPDPSSIVAIHSIEQQVLAASQKEMRDRITSVNSTKKITEAMKLVAAAKVRSGYTGSRTTAFAW
jgi:hypothetical protein